MGSTCRTRRALHTDKVETQQEQSGACIMRIHAVQAQGTQCIGLKSVQPRMANMCSQIANPEVKRLISADDILRHYRSHRQVQLYAAKLTITRRMALSGTLLKSTDKKCSVCSGGHQ
ncbi:hypothetical protein WJX77_009172 [Trebouxia sp. C0004]